MFQGKRAAHRGVGVIAEGTVLVFLRVIWEPTGKDLLFRVLGGLAAALLAVDQRDFWVRKRSEHLLQPIGVDRVDVRAGKHQDFPAGGLNTAVERTPEGELLGFDAHHVDRVALGDIYGSIFGA